MRYPGIDLRSPIIQGEAMKRSRLNRLADTYKLQQAMNPNSMQNQLARLKIEQARMGGNIGTYNPRDYTTKSFAQFQASGNPQVLKRYEPPMRPMKVDRGDMVELYHPTTSQLITSIPKNLAPDQELDYIRDARETEKGVDMEMNPKIERETINAGETAKRQQAMIGESQKSISNMMTQNENLDKVIRAAEEGANTGPLMSRLPSMTEASIRMDQLQREMGLNVIGSVTFGALSAPELKLALQTAIPTQLEGPELIKWAREKQVANRKLMSYLNEQVQYLSKGGTSEEWLNNKIKNSGLMSDDEYLRRKQLLD